MTYVPTHNYRCPECNETIFSLKPLSGDLAAHCFPCASRKKRERIAVLEATIGRTDPNSRGLTVDPETCKIIRLEHQWEWLP